MRNTIFWGAGKIGNEAYETFLDFGLENSFKGYIDSKSNSIHIDKRVITEKEIDIVNDIVVITVGVAKNVVDIYNTCTEMGVRNIYWYCGLRNRKTEGGFLDKYCVSCEKWGDLVFPQAEIHAVDFCNLNCRGCTHFSPIFDNEQPSVEERLDDVKALSEKFSHIVKFFILGGEPFLSDDIGRLISETRKCLPNTMIQIVTNGLLIPKLQQDIFEIIRENNIVISISEYEPTHRIIDKIVETLEEQSICYNIRPFDIKTKFNKPLAISGYDNYEKLCISNGCVNIWKGKIARCPSLMYIDEFNNHFGTDLPNEGIYYIKDLTGEEIIEEMNKDVPLCNHCVKNEIPWGRCSKEPILTDFAEMD